MTISIFTAPKPALTDRLQKAGYTPADYHAQVKPLGRMMLVTLKK